MHSQNLPFYSEEPQLPTDPTILLPTSGSISVVIIRENGKTIPVGTVAYYNQNRFKHYVYNVFYKLRSKMILWFYTTILKR